MLSFREARLRFKIKGFHCHHVIPLEIVERRGFAAFFGVIRAAGFNPHDFLSNGMHLPSDERQAAIFRLPLHRGAHPRYNEMVAERVAGLADLPTEMALRKIGELQVSLKEGLRMGQRVSKTVRQPFQSAADFRRLDEEVALLWEYASGQCDATIGHRVVRATSMRSESQPADLLIG
jgi:A nuclease family of the HNH/ENDO VII superfamily with conserved AHH